MVWPDQALSNWRCGVRMFGQPIRAMVYVELLGTCDDGPEGADLHVRLHVGHQALEDTAYDKDLFCLRID